MYDGTSDSKRSEPTHLASLLDVESLDVNLYRSTDLRLPRGARGIFGGQVISQAIVAATKTVDQAFHLHSLHCYFVLNGLPTTIYYNVDRIRNGRSYSTRAVRAVQNGKTIFIMLCSFQKPEPWQPTYRSPMPKVAAPEECETLQVYYRKRATEQTDDWAKGYFIVRAKMRERSPIEVRQAAGGSQDGYYVQCHWMRAISLPECDAAYQKAVLGYISDVYFLETGSNALGLRESSEEGADVVAFFTTIDHSIWYYSDDFDCSQWLMFESRVPQVGSGRAIVHRRVFTRDGTLIANFSQEGVVRARVHGPEESRKVESKL
ncbi:Thioesterase/thiol ester dehydrase-isomerase [Thelephora ganbajun]|uniref:Thioesterase/thiol ester dehydrase-isomerase n=1 Tax=Thelephora ganbajun TaxID=370292 RepID=A0ACB6ZM95_THEGA|nr:Thioesterase/thiol ester dehydrase-isomerase [Thelephora ganbajun]